MRRGKGFQWFVISLMFILIIGSARVSCDDQTTFATDLKEKGMRVAGISHAPIVIDGDANFSITATNEGWLGDGTSGNPYIIEGLDIDIGGAAGHCINIINTRVNFTISNCILKGANTSAGAGINLKNVTNGLLIENTLSHSQQAFYFNHSSFVLIKNNTVTDCYYSIQMLSSSDNTIADNNVSFNHRGIQLLLSSNNNTVVNNTFTDDIFGITLYEINYNVFENNTISMNDRGINILDEDSNYNDFRWNVIWANAENGYNSNSTNIFDSNYWSDYTGIDTDLDGVGDTPYIRWLNLTDNLPLMLLPNGLAFEWAETPTDQLIEYGAGLNCTLYYRSYSLMAYPLWLNDTFYFEINDERTLVSVFSLPVGDYGIKIEFSDAYGNVLDGIFTVSVRDTTSPAWSIEPADLTISHENGLDLQITAWDLSGIDYWVINDTTHFTISFALYSGGSTARIINSTVLEPGSYGLNLTVYDPYGNYCSKILYLVVLGTPSTATSPTTTSLTTSETPGGVDPMLTLVMGTGIGAITVVIIFIVILKKK